MFDLSTLLPLIGLLMIAGALAGIAAGLLGVGGGIVNVPAFFFVFSALGFGSTQLMQVCVGTSLAAIVFTSLRSVSAHNAKGAVDWDLLRGWAPWIVAGAVLGVGAATRISSDALVVFFACFALVLSLYMLFGNKDWRLADQPPGVAGRAGYAGGIGFFSVLLGIGGGSFSVPILTLYSVPIHRAVATSAGFGGVIALPSAMGFMVVPIEAAPPLTIGAVNLPALAIAVGMTMLTAPIGAKLAHRFAPQTLRYAFGGFAFLVALNMLRQAVWS